VGNLLTVKERDEECGGPAGAEDEEGYRTWCFGLFCFSIGGKKLGERTIVGFCGSCGGQ
jgi:hypothetical protein